MSLSSGEALDHSAPVKFGGIQGRMACRKMTQSGSVQPKTACRPTILDLERETGAPRTTVFRVVSGSIHVAPTTRALVLDAIRRNQLEVNAAARMSRAERSGLGGLLVPNIHAIACSTLAEVLEQGLSREGMSLPIANSGGTLEGEVPSQGPCDLGRRTPLYSLS
jgi:hypothetical protein